MKFSLAVLSSLSLVPVAGAALAEERAYGDFVSVMLENDLLTGKDGGYTSGFAVTWSHGELGEFSRDNLPDWIYALSKGLYVSTAAGKRRAVSYSIAQTIQTPSDVTVETLIEDEAPYVGLLSWRASLHAYDDRVADRLSLTLGVVGPLSGAEEAQIFVHKVFGSDEPRGWDHQIENEPVLQVSAERLWRLVVRPIDGDTGVDVIGITRGEIGTLQSQLATGLGARYGGGLDRSFPTATVLPGRQVNPLAGSVTRSWHVFLNVLGGFVANDISIDGNTFRESHSVPLEHWQAQAVAGMSFNLGRWAYLLSAVIATDRYEGQDGTTHFGSISATYNY